MKARFEPLTVRCSYCPANAEVRCYSCGYRFCPACQAAHQKCPTGLPTGGWVVEIKHDDGTWSREVVEDTQTWGPSVTDRFSVQIGEYWSAKSKTLYLKDEGVTWRWPGY